VAVILLLSALMLLIVGITAAAYVIAVAGFPAVAGLLAIAYIRVDKGIPILAGVLAYCTVQ
jgi:hypothetical protein